MSSPASNRSLEGGGEPSTTPSARAAAEIIAITTRDDFLLEIGEALSGQTSVRPVDSVDTALDQVGGNRRMTQLIAIDARDVEDVRGAIEQVNGNAPHLVVLVFAAAESEKQTAASLKGVNVFAVLSIPIDKRKTAAVLDGAVAEAVKRKPAAPARPAVDRNTSIVIEPAEADAPSFSTASDESSGGGRNMAVIGGSVAAVVILGAAAAWFFTRDAAPPAAGTPPQASVSIEANPENLPGDEDIVAEAAAPVVNMQLVDGTVDELLEKARAAMRERRYTEPNNDNALLYYRSAVQVEPENAEAKDGLRRVGSVLNARFEEDLAAGRYDDAALTLAHLKVATPEDERLASFESKLVTGQVTRMLADGNLERAAALVKGAQQSGVVPEAQITRWRTEIARRQDEARQKRLVDLVQDRIRDGRLSDPDNDNAKLYLEQLKDLGPSAASAYQRTARELGAAYMRKAREAAQANRGPDVDRWLAEARSVGVSASEVNAFQRDLSAARQKQVAAENERLANLARDRLKEGKLVEPANDSAAFYLTALQSADANHSYVATGSRELATRLLDRASTHAREGRTAQAETDLGQARRWGADPKDIQAIQQAAAARRATPARPATAAAARQESPPEDLQSRLKRVRYQDPVFPERALAQGISGSVTVEFTVNTDGEPQDIRVVAAEPAGTFDRAALNAVKRWRYAPVVVDNVPQEVTTRAIIRFDAQN